MKQAAAAHELDANRVRKALTNVLASPNFCNSPQLSAFLSHVVERTLKGLGSTLKAYAIATEALGRPTAFDPVNDATVRVLAGRVRSALELYNLRNGPNEDTVIELLPGSYVPHFRFRSFPSVVQLRTPINGQNSVIQPNDFNSTTQINSLTNANAAERLLILEDDAEIRSILRRVGEDSGFVVVDTAHANEFWVAYQALRPTHVILDLMLPGANGLEIMQELGRLSSKCQITLLSGVDSRLLRTTQRLGRELGLEIAAALSKPFNIDDIERAISLTRKSVIGVSVADLSHAIESSQLMLCFQPMISWSVDGVSQLSGLEALVRWNHPVHGLMFPDDFLPLAEDNGLVIPLTQRVIELAINQLLETKADFPEIRISVSLSAVSLDDQQLPDFVGKRLDAAGIERKCFIIQIPENAAANDGFNHVNAIARLRLSGFTLSINDFGTGQSSLAKLIQIPFNELKIAECFVQEIDKNDDAWLVVRNVIELAKSMGLRACANGVKNEEILRLLRDLGCNSAQGPVFSEPVAADKLSTVLERIERRRW